MSSDPRLTNSQSVSDSVGANADQEGSGAGIAPGSVSVDTATEAARAEGIVATGNAGLPETHRLEPGALPPADAFAVRAADLRQIQAGWQVYASDGELLGAVAAVAADHFTVASAASSRGDMFIPEQYIETIANRRVVLSKPKRVLMDMKLDEAPFPASTIQKPHEAALSAESAVSLDQLPQSDIGAERTHVTAPPLLTPDSAAGERPTKVSALNVRVGWRIEDAGGRYIGIVDGFTDTSLKLVQTTAEEQFVPLDSIAETGNGIVRLKTMALEPAATHTGQPAYPVVAVSVGSEPPTSPVRTNSGESPADVAAATGEIPPSPAGRQRGRPGDARTAGARAEPEEGEAGYLSSQLGAEREPVARVTDRPDLPA
ncbi:MAG: DUF2171 domain-containing protein [Dehalococcoidia bacterium]